MVVTVVLEWHWSLECGATTNATRYLVSCVKKFSPLHRSTIVQLIFAILSGVIEIIYGTFYTLFSQSVSHIT